MANKRKHTKKRNPNQITAPGEPDKDQAVAIARTVLRPTVQAAVTPREYGKSYGDLDLSGMIEALSEQTKTITGGDLKRGEAMLTAQAHTLDAVFNNLTQRAINAERIDNLDRYLKLALRAQSQCRATWEALTTIKNPPIVGYVRQANIAHGPQQVNNTPSAESEAPRAPENSNLQNKLLEEKDGERLDTGTTGSAGRTDPAMPAVGKVHRTEDAGGVKTPSRVTHTRAVPGDSFANWRARCGSSRITCPGSQHSVRWSGPPRTKRMGSC